MRLLLAGLFVMGMVFGTAGLLSSLSGDGEAPLWAQVVVYAVLAATILIAMQFFNRRGYRLSGKPRNSDEMKGMLARWNLLASESFRARRAFRVEPFRSLGPIYFVELADGRVLCLRGEYLYEFEPLADAEDPADNHPRQFPCTEFQVFRHRVTRDVFDFHCGGEVFEPELNAPGLSMAQFKQRLPDDGAFITDRSYDQLKREHEGEIG